MASGRWLRLDAAWEDSEWLDELDGVASGSWPRILSYVKTHGIRGICKRPSLRVLARKWRVPAESIEALEDAAVADGALAIEDDEWIVTNWSKYQPSDPKAADRKRRQRERREKSRMSRRDMRDTGGTGRDQEGPDGTPRDPSRDMDRDIDSTTPPGGGTENPDGGPGSPPPSPPATDAGGSSPRTEEEDATDGTSQPTATTLTEWERVARAEVDAWNHDFPATLEGLRDENYDQHALVQLQKDHGKTAEDFARWRRWLKDERKVPQFYTRPRQYLHLSTGGQEKWALIDAQSKAQGGRGGPPEPATTYEPGAWRRR